MEDPTGLITDLLCDPEDLSKASGIQQISSAAEPSDQAIQDGAVLRRSVDQSGNTDHVKRTFRPSVVIDSDLSDSESDFGSSSCDDSVAGDAAVSVSVADPYLDVDNLSLMAGLGAEGVDSANLGGGVNDGGESGNAEFNVTLDHGMDSDSDVEDGVTQTDQEEEEDGSDEPPKKKRKKLRPWKKLKRIFTGSNKKEKKRQQKGDEGGTKHSKSEQSLEQAEEEPVISTEQFILSSSRQGDADVNDDQALSQQIEKSLANLPRPRSDSDEGLPLSPDMPSLSPDRLGEPSRPDRPSRDSGNVSPGEEKSQPERPIPSPRTSLKNLPNNEQDDVFEPLTTTYMLNSDAARHRIAVRPESRRPSSKNRLSQETSPRAFDSELSPRAFASESKCCNGDGSAQLTQLPDLPDLISPRAPNERPLSGVMPDSGIEVSLLGVRPMRMGPRPGGYQVGLSWSPRMSTPLEEEEWERTSSESDSDDSTSSDSSSSSGTSMEDSMELNESHGSTEVEFIDLTTMIRRWSDDYVKGIDEESPMEIKSALDSSRRQPTPRRGIPTETKRHLNGILDQLIEESREVYTAEVSPGNPVNGSHHDTANLGDSEEQKHEAEDGFLLKTPEVIVSTERDKFMIGNSAEDEPTPSVQTEDKLTEFSDGGETAAVELENVPRQDTDSFISPSIVSNQNIGEKVAEKEKILPEVTDSLIADISQETQEDKKEMVIKDKTEVTTAQDKVCIVTRTPILEQIESKEDTIDSVENGHAVNVGDAEKPRSIRDRMSRFQPDTTPARAPKPNPLPRARKKVTPDVPTSAVPTSGAKVDIHSTDSGLSRGTPAEVVHSESFKITDMQTTSSSIESNSTLIEPSTRSPPVAKVSPLPARRTPGQPSPIIDKKRDVERSIQNCPVIARNQGKSLSSPAVNKRIEVTSSENGKDSPSPVGSPPSAKKKEGKESLSPTRKVHNKSPPPVWKRQSSPSRLKHDRNSSASPPPVWKRKSIPQTRKSDDLVSANKKERMDSLPPSPSPRRGVPLTKTGVHPVTGVTDPPSARISPLSARREVKSRSSPLASRRQDGAAMKEATVVPGISSVRDEQKNEHLSSPPTSQKHPLPLESQSSSFASRRQDGAATKEPTVLNGISPGRIGNKKGDLSSPPTTQKQTLPNRLNSTPDVAKRNVDAPKATPSARISPLPPTKEQKSAASPVVSRSQSAPKSLKQSKDDSPSFSRKWSHGSRTENPVSKQQDKTALPGSPENVERSKHPSSGAEKPTTGETTWTKPSSMQAPPSRKTQSSPKKTREDKTAVPGSPKNGEQSKHPSLEAEKPTTGGTTSTKPSSMQASPSRKTQSSPKKTREDKTAVPGSPENGEQSKHPSLEVEKPTTGGTTWTKPSSMQAPPSRKTRSSPKKTKEVVSPVKMNGEDYEAPPRHGKGGVAALIMRFQDSQQQQQFNTQQRTTSVVS